MRKRLVFQPSLRSATLLSFLVSLLHRLQDRFAFVEAFWYVLESVGSVEVGTGVLSVLHDLVSRHALAHSLEQTFVNMSREDRCNILRGRSVLLSGILSNMSKWILVSSTQPLLTFFSIFG